MYLRLFFPKTRICDIRIIDELKNETVAGLSDFTNDSYLHIIIIHIETIEKRERYQN